MDIKIGASILAADFAHLDREMLRIEKAGIDFFHIDIMDGHFVPNITIGPDILGNIRRVSSIPLDVHLMIKNPLKWTNRFIAAGADMLSLHIETVSSSAYFRCVRRIKSKGIKLGISLNPGTPLKRIEALLDKVDFVLVMTVNPGFGGQGFISSVLTKIKALRKIYKGDIAVDGGINELTAKRVIKAGANILACGTYIFRARHPRQAIEKLKDLTGL
jgi:ribulose-phosphate 3-epimerase